MIDRLSPARAALLVIDVQERLLAAMPPSIAAQTVKNVKILIETATRFELPIVVSQQYPKGLGATVPELEAALPKTAHRYDKIEFSAPSAPGFPAVQRDQWIVTGMETHVCVYQSVRDLIGSAAGGKNAVHVVADAVASRTKQNWRAGLGLMTTLGAITTTTEVCLFDLLERAGTETFKTLSKAIR
jgi:nicotinamidase-related amidase